MVIAADGTVVVEADGTDEQILSADIDPDHLAAWRAEFPALRDRRSWLSAPGWHRPDAGLNLSTRSPVGSETGCGFDTRLAPLLNHREGGWRRYSTTREEAGAATQPPGGAAGADSTTVSGWRSPGARLRLWARESSSGVLLLLLGVAVPVAVPVAVTPYPSRRLLGA